MSLLTTFSKILEKVMYNRLSQHMHCNNKLAPEQLDFRKCISTEDAAYKLTENVLQPVNQKMHVGGIFCDLAKAFDCVSREGLLNKSHFYGIQGTGAEWFRSCLVDRKQKGQNKDIW
jgi:hypothetical protein